MSHLGAVLDLPEGSRLTGITLHPSPAVLSWGLHPTAHLQIVQLPETAEPSAIAGALSVFLPELFASLHGTPSGGGSWAAFLLLTDSELRVIPRDVIALAPLRRALKLLGLDSAEARSLPLTDKALQWAYRQKDLDVETDWSLRELLLGLLVELTEVPLKDAVDFANGSEEAGPQGREERLASLLESWSAK